MRRLCITCETRPARQLRANFTKESGSDYTYNHATSEPYFCSKRCAAAWALLHCADHQSWCPKHGWYLEDGCPCPECVEERTEPCPAREEGGRHDFQISFADEEPVRACIYCGQPW